MPVRMRSKPFSSLVTKPQIAVTKVSLWEVCRVVPSFGGAAGATLKRASGCPAESVFQIMMGYTFFGRAIYAVGGNAEAARLSGINVRRVKIVAMGALGLLAALSGVMQSSQIMAGSASTAMGWELDVIFAVIIGGASLLGGAGTMWGTLIGVIFLGVLVNGMTLLNISEYWQHVVRGGLILLAVLINVSQAKESR